MEIHAPGRASTWSPTTVGRGLIAPKPTTQRLGRVDEWRASVHRPSRADVGDGDRSPGHRTRIQLARARQWNQPLDLSGKLGEAHRVGIVNHRHDQPTLGVGGDAD